MTQVAEPATRREPQSPPPRRDTRAGRWPVVITMVVALVACGLSGQWADSWKQQLGGAYRPLSESRALSGMNSYSLALMLGGLRGPLVMVLWSKVENQKIDRDLEDVDTMIEWIRLLQPEFDTVHIFQIWNKAYNISALMASTGSKYTTILDAADYARRVDAERPGDINILDQLARVFGEKLGGVNVAERVFYRRQFRLDSMTDSARAKAYPEQSATYHRMGFKFLGDKNGPLLDDNNNLLPPLVTERFKRPADLPAGSEWNNGAELQYIAPYQPFPYGVPPIAMGFNYAKRAQVAMTVGGQKPLQLSPQVIDSYPPLLLKQWAEREQERATIASVRAFGVKGDNPDVAASAQASPPNGKVTDSHSYEAALFGFRLAARLCQDAYKEYDRHLSNPEYLNSYVTYTSHKDELQAETAMDRADLAYLSSFSRPADQAHLLAEAGGYYREALTRYEQMVLMYNVEEAVRAKAFPDPRLDVRKLSDEATDRLYAQAMAVVQSLPPTSREHDDERNELGAYIMHAALRLQQLGSYGQRSILQTH